MKGYRLMIAFRKEGFSMETDPKRNFNESVKLQDTYNSELITESILVDKVFAHYQQSDSLQQVMLKLPEDGTYEFIEIVFSRGDIIPGSQWISEIPNRPNFKRVQMEVNISYSVELMNKETGRSIKVNGILPQLKKDLIMFIPEAKDEFTFDIVMDTTSKLMAEPIFEGEFLIFAAMIQIIYRVVGRIQLFIPAFSFCPTPAEGEVFIPPIN